MTRYQRAGHLASAKETLGAALRHLRTEIDMPLWKVAAAAAMDAALLSKIELGQRLPTRNQVTALARFFGIAATELESMRMAEKFLSENGHNPAAAVLALARIQENAGEYEPEDTPP